jgi:Xaa-Pro dipeptidase
VVPQAEIEQRLARLRSGLRRQGLDGALVVQVTDLLYLTGTVQSAHLVVPAEGEPALYVRRLLERARRESPLERVEPLTSLRELEGALARAGLRGGRLGLELDVLPAQLYLDYARRLPEFELVDCSPLLRRLRSRKSEWEVARTREAGAMLAQAYERIPSLLREGMSEIELAAGLELALRRLGHQGLARFRAFNQESSWVAVTAGPSAAVGGGADTPIVGTGPGLAVSRGSSHRPIGRGEPVVVDCLGTSEGYLADQTRLYSVGPLEPRFRDAFEHARRVLHATAAAARPGVAWAALYERAREAAADAPGFMGGVSFVGHGLGLEVDEPPFLARGFDDPLEPGMVFAIEPKFLFPGEGAVGIEHTYAMTGDGLERLTPTPEALVEV